MTTLKPAVKPLPRAMLIDMDDTILSAYGRPEIAWNQSSTEFAEGSWPSRRDKCPLDRQLFWTTELVASQSANIAVR